ncbi:hypothetical protein [Ekhidna sp.]
MNRRIITQSYHSTQAGDTDKHFDKVIKYIPADIVAAWLTAKGIILSTTPEEYPQENALWISFSLGLIATFFWTLRQTRMENKKPAYFQAVFSSVAFLIWVIAIGQPFSFHPATGSLVLLGFTIISGFINPPENN